MTPATSVSFFRSEFDDFLYAAIGVDSNESPLSVLSAFARLNLDPWHEAAALAALPRGLAAARVGEDDRATAQGAMGRGGAGCNCGALDRALATPFDCCGEGS